MYRIRIVFIILFSLIVSSCSGQDDNSVYILFKDGQSVPCIQPKTNKKADPSTVDYQGKMHKLDEKTFFFCQERFVKINDKSQKMMLKDIKAINFVDHTYLYQEHIKRDMFSKKDTFKTIYLIEETESKNYIKHQVYWSDI